MCEPPICSIRILHRLIDLVAAAQLFFLKNLALALVSRQAVLPTLLILSDSVMNLLILSKKLTSQRPTPQLCFLDELCDRIA